MDIWEVLRLEETCDTNAIKKAYADRAKEFNSEEHMDEFLKIRQAYEKALVYAKEAVTAQTMTKETLTQKNQVGYGGCEDSQPQNSEFADIQNEETIYQESQKASSGLSWNVTLSMEENPFQNREGIQRFRELYTGKRCRDRMAWSDYFVSDGFLEGYREAKFAQLMLEVVKENAEEYPPGKEFLTELYITYGLSAHNTYDDKGQKGMELVMDSTSPFQGIELIGEIAQMGPAITRFKGNDYAMTAGFRDYRELLAITREEVWNDDILVAVGKIIDRYGLSNISDRPMWNAAQYELSQRHPKSLKLITYFFRNVQGEDYLKDLPHTEFPAEVYRMLWSHLGLKNATQGRERLLYGGLREAVIAHVPEVMEESKVDFKKLTQEFFYNFHRGGIICYSNEGRTPEEREQLDQFFRREDVQIALRDEAFIDKQISRYWITKNSGNYLLEKLEEFYYAHRDLPFANLVLEKIVTAKDKKRIEDAFQEDARAEIYWDKFDMGNRAFLRYYLNTAFHIACGVRNQITLEAFLQDRMPYSEEWNKRIKPSLELQVRNGKEDILSIHFHVRYMEYLWNGSPMVPRFPGQALAEVDNDTYFWLLAPIASAPLEEYVNIYEELAGRLSKLPIWEGDIPVIADCIAGYICHFQEEVVPICSFYAENEKQLFGGAIHEDGTLIIYEEVNHRKIPISCDSAIPDLDTAIKMGRRLLQEMTIERDMIRWDVMVPLEVLPKRLLLRDKWNIASELEGEDVTEEVIHKYLEEYFKGKLNRLELDFDRRSLVFLKDGELKRYACFYFEDLKQRWFRLVGIPEVYKVVDEKDVVYEPFGLGSLPNYVLHHNLGYMESQLEEVFAQVACQDPNPKCLVWSPEVYFTAEQQQYYLAKRLYGAYPAEQACNRLQGQFYVPVVPMMLSYVDKDGKQWKRVDVSRDKRLVQDMLAMYMAGQLNRLVLDWEYLVQDSAGGRDVRDRYIVLIQHEGKHQMFYLDDSNEGMEYLVANVDQYLKAENRKYHKVMFDNRRVPAYLVHTEMRRIRDCLDILLPQIENPAMILRQFGEFCYICGEECEMMRKTYLD